MNNVDTSALSMTQLFASTTTRDQPQQNQSTQKKKKKEFCWVPIIQSFWTTSLNEHEFRFDDARSASSVCASLPELYAHHLTLQMTHCKSRAMGGPSIFIHNNDNNDAASVASRCLTTTISDLRGWDESAVHDRIATCFQHLTPRGKEIYAIFYTTFEHMCTEQVQKLYSQQLQKNLAVVKQKLAVLQIAVSALTTPSGIKQKPSIFEASATLEKQVDHIRSEWDILNEILDSESDTYVDELLETTDDTLRYLQVKYGALSSRDVKNNNHDDAGVHEIDHQNNNETTMDWFPQLHNTLVIL